MCACKFEAIQIRTTQYSMKTLADMHEKNNSLCFVCLFPLLLSQFGSIDGQDIGFCMHPNVDTIEIVPRFFATNLP